MRLQRVGLITLGVADLAAARRFYGDQGWVEADGSDGVAFFQMQGQVLGFFGRVALGSRPRSGCFGAGIRAIGPIRMGMSGRWR
jgi:catechol 2,3-dioxygenase-like lactoylglutathione lyase family enzyme